MKDIFKILLSILILVSGLLSMYWIGYFINDSPLNLLVYVENTDWFLLLICGAWHLALLGWLILGVEFIYSLIK